MFALAFQVKSLANLIQAEGAIQARTPRKLILSAQQFGNAGGQRREGAPLAMGRRISPGRPMGNLTEASVQRMLEKALEQLIRELAL